MRLWRISLALVVIFATVLAAFPALTPMAEAEEEVEIVFWSMWNEGEPQAEVYKKWIATYEELNPDIKVKIVFNGRENQTKLRTALAGGTVVDLMDQDALQVAGGLMVDGAGYAVDDWLDEPAYGEDTPFRDIFVPGTLVQNVADDGHTYLIPYTLITVAFWYDKRNFEDAGVEKPPETWEEFLEVCAQLEEYGLPPIAEDGQADQYNEFWFYHLVERLEGSGFLLAATEDPSGEAWEHPSFMKTLEMIDEARQYFIEGWDGFVWPAGQMELAMGTAGMELCGSWLPNELKVSVDPEFDWGGFAFPSVEGGKGARTDMEAYLLSWMILKDAPHAREAFDFIKFCMTEENQMMVVGETLNASARAGVPWPDVIKDGEAMFAEATATFEGLDWMQSKHAEYFTTIFRPTYRQVFLGQITPEEFITQMKEQTAAYWAE